MFTRYGLDVILAALARGAGAYGLVLVSGGSKSRIFKVDAGFPRRGDTDEANDGRGDNVLTWRFTVPRGEKLLGPATEAELVDEGGGEIYATRLPYPFHANGDRASILYLNIYLGAH